VPELDYHQHGLTDADLDESFNIDYAVYGKESMKLRDLAHKNQRKFLYETNVGPGLPVIENLQNLLAAGDEVESFDGILSGSLSFIFGKLEEFIRRTVGRNDFNMVRNM